jgi:hypothetical protein
VQAVSGFSLRVRLSIGEIERYRISGWRGLCSFEGIVAPDGANLFGCELTLEGADQFTAGQEVLASLWFWAPQSYAPGLAPGLAMRLFEGPHEIASGVIVDVNSDSN